MQLYEDTRKPLNEIEIRLRSIERGHNLSHQSNDAGGDLLVIFLCLALCGALVDMSRYSGYIRYIERRPLARPYISDTPLVP